MSAIDELRRMLDERGIHWWAGDDERKTLWESNSLTWEYFSFENGDAWLGFLGACEQDITPEQAIAATLGGGTLTAEHVREAIFGNSSYASYDGAKYYADGIGMQAVADELNTRVERTCETCPQMDNPDSFIRHLMGGGKMYAVKTWSELDDWGESYIERRLYRSKEEAERRAEEVRGESCDELWYDAMVVEFEVAEP